MNRYVTGSTIRALREKKKMTQKQLAELLLVSDKTVSKWETDRGLPDIAMLEPLAAVLNVSVAELLSGECVTNTNRCANLLRSKFYVCPVCGNVIWSTGEGAFSCCGIQLPPLEAEEADDAHTIQAERIETEWFVHMDHPMTKGHSIRFFACVTGDRAHIVQLYPEQNAEARFFLRGHGHIYAYCNRHGLTKIRI